MKTLATIHAFVVTSVAFAGGLVWPSATPKDCPFPKSGCSRGKLTIKIY